MSSQVKRPVLRWHGGKWRIAPWIISHFPTHKVYVEPFGGAASVLLRKPRVATEIYNDLGDSVVNMFRVLRDPVMAEKLVKLIWLTPFARTEFEESYAENPDDKIEWARQLITRSYMGFGSDSSNKKRATGFRINATRSHTSPAGDFANWPDKILAVVRRLRGVMIERRPAIEVIERFDGPQTLHYVDPPYVMSTRSDRPGKYTHELDDKDHAELARVLKGLKGFVVLSGYRSPIYNKLYSGWKRHDFKTVTNGNHERIESLWLNDKAAQGAQGNLF